MPTSLTVTTLFVSFIITLITTPYWIKKARRAGLIGKDKHKIKRTFVAEVGGLPVISGFLLAMLYYTATRVFVYGQENGDIVFVFASIISILIATIIGLVDDILGWKIGLRARYKVFLSIFIPLPIMVVNAGQSTITIPLLGQINSGLLFPLLFIPIGIIGAANGFNMLAGFNGLEAGQGILILSTLGWISYQTGSGFAAVLSLAMVFSLLAFSMFNKYPAKVFPGDTLTYSVGALIAIVAILANIEKYALILFIPYYIEFVLKARGKMKKESFARLDSRGGLKSPYKRIYGIEHVAIRLVAVFKKKVTENSVVLLILSFQFVVSLATLLYFYQA